MTNMEEFQEQLTRIEEFVESSSDSSALEEQVRSAVHEVKKLSALLNSSDSPTNVTATTGTGDNTSLPLDIVKKPSEIVVRIGIDMLFTYPEVLEDYDQLRRLEIYSEGVKIVEYSTTQKKERTHFVRNADIVSWV